MKFECLLVVLQRLTEFLMKAIDIHYDLRACPCPARLDYKRLEALPVPCLYHISYRPQQCWKLVSRHHLIDINLCEAGSEAPTSQWVTTKSTSTQASTCITQKVSDQFQLGWLDSSGVFKFELSNSKLLEVRTVRT